MDLKKPLSLLLALVFICLLSILASCGNNGEQKPSSGTTGEKPPVSTSQPSSGALPGTPTDEQTASFSESRTTKAPVSLTETEPPETPTAPETPDPTPTVIPDIPTTKTPDDEERISISLTEGKLTVTLRLEEHANEEAALLLLSDHKAQNTWKTTDRDKVVDLCQITLDGDGSGIAQLVCETDAPAYLYITIGGSAYYKGVNQS